MIQIRLSVLATLTGLFAPGAAAQGDSDLVLLNGSIVPLCSRWLAMLSHF